MFCLSKTKLAFSLACVLLSAGTPANASTYTVQMLQVPDALQSSGFDVVATGSGTINITNLSFSPVSTLAQMVPSASVLITGGPGTVAADQVSLAFSSGFSSFGPGGGHSPNTSSGNIAGLAGGTLGAGALYVPVGYNGTDTLSNSATWNNATLASLGLTPGTYIWTWTNPIPAAPIFAATTANTFTIQIGSAPVVPLPATLPLFATGLGALGLLGWRRKKKLTG